MSKKKRLPVVITKITEDSFEKLSQWHYEEWKNINPEYSASRRTQAFKRQLASEGVPQTFVAHLKGELVGSASIVIHDMAGQTPPLPWLTSVYVLEEHRGKGIGKALIKKANDYMKKLGIKQYFLFVYPDKFSLYKKLGWKVLKETEYRGEKVTIMMLNL